MINSFLKSHLQYLEYLQMLNLNIRLKIESKLIIFNASLRLSNFKVEKTEDFSLFLKI
jgi:hypothetical protein